MTRSIRVPQDLIVEILSHLHDDTATLRACCLVSHAFRRPSRCYLLSTVALHSAGAISSFHRFLLENPAISPAIHCLHFSLAYPPVEELSDMLPKLNFVRRIRLGTRNHFTNPRDPPNLSAPLSLLFRLPRLEQIDILFILHFPTSLLQIAQNLRYLTIDTVSIDPDDATSSIQVPLLPLLQRVCFRTVIYHLGFTFLHAPNLRQMSLGGSIRVRDYIGAGWQSIEDLVFYEYGIGYGWPIDLGILQRLRRFSFITSDELERGVASLENPWTHIENMFPIHRTGLGLEEFNLIINRPPKVSQSIYSDALVGVGDLWTHLADRVRFPRLRRVAIYLDIRGCGPSITQDNVQAVISRKLPMLAEEGLLYAMMCEDFEWNDLL